jgi:MFS transporter, DHA3 family, tetracycline resistance protein
VCHRGYVLTPSLYFVTQAHLSAAQLVLLGTGMAVTLTVSDIPAGVWSDAFSRKWPLVLGHGFLAAGMLLTGLVTAFPLLLTARARWDLTGGMAGMLAFGVPALACWSPDRVGAS